MFNSGLYRFVLFMLFLSGLFTSSFAQNELFIPLNVKKAYLKGTRNIDGTPGPNYWQNSSDYKIKVQVDPVNKIVYGSEQLIYYNNSPDTLRMLVIRLYQDIFKVGNARDFSTPEKAINKGVIFNKILLRGKNIDSLQNVSVNRRGTNMLITLDKPVPPNSNINLSFEWSFIIPQVMNLRMGTYDSTSFFIGYWYPQMAVYDDIDGWDRYNYGGQQEFYNDFSNYEVEIRVPNKFGVWATGVLQNPDEVLTGTYLERYNKAHNTTEVVRIVTEEDLNAGNIFSSENQFNVWKYKAEYVPDFAFALSDHYLWDAVSTVVDSVNNRRTYIQAVYKGESEDFYDVARIAKEAIEYFSFEMPAVPFPFPSLTVFNGSGGMEFPMMVNDGSARNYAGTVGLTSHEIAHSYFPFFMGTNERKYAFMDEGWAVMLPYNFQERADENNHPRRREAMLYQRVAGTDKDIPLIVPSVYLTGTAYRTSAYSRPANAYEFLRNMLGDELFLKALHEFMQRWNGRHPIPYDFFFTFNNVIGKSLNWYWSPWFLEFGYPDLSITGVTISGNDLNVKVKNEGNIPVPVKLTFVFTDSTESYLVREASVWADGRNEITIPVKTTKQIDKIIVGSPEIPDVNYRRNTYLIKRESEQ